MFRALALALMALNPGRRTDYPAYLPMQNEPKIAPSRSSLL